MTNDVLKEAVRINREIYDMEHCLKDMDNVMQGDVKIEVDVLNEDVACKCILFDDDPVVGEELREAVMGVLARKREMLSKKLDILRREFERI